MALIQIEEVAHHLPSTEMEGSKSKTALDPEDMVLFRIRTAFLEKSASISGSLAYSLILLQSYKNLFFLHSISMDTRKIKALSTPRIRTKISNSMVIEKHEKMDSVSPLSTQFSQQCILSSCEEHTHVVFYEGGVGHISQKNCYGEPPPLIEKNRPICRGIPVKETTNLRRGQNAEGKKMINEYVREHKIGSGSYGKVVLYRSSSGMPFAIKALSKSRLSRVRVAPAETAMTDVLREVSIMKRLEHQNIVNLIEVIDDPESDRFYMVLEYVEGKWVCDSAGTPGGIGEGCARKYFRDIIAGVMYLHENNIIHGDIKPENLLVTKSGRVKIGDFSVSNAFEGDNDELWRTPGTPAFTAPECCLGLTYHGKAADTWAVGVTLYCMILGSCPFMGDCLRDTYERIISCPLSLPEKLDHELKDLLRGLLCKDPMQRITLDVAASHPWVVREGGPVCQTSCRCKEKMDIVDFVALA